MNKKLILAISAAAAALTACTTATPPPAAVAPAPAAPAATAESAHDRLFRLFKESDEASLRRNPLNAMFRGDMRYADRFGDFVTDAYYAGEKAAAEKDLAELHAIDRAALNATDRSVAIESLTLVFDRLERA